MVRVSQRPEPPSQKEIWVPTQVTTPVTVDCPMPVQVLAGSSVSVSPLLQRWAIMAWFHAPDTMLVARLILSGPPNPGVAVPLIQPSAAGFESSYTGLQIAGLAACTLILMVCGMMMYDVLRNQWSWQGAYPVNSALMDTILGWLGMS